MFSDPMPDGREVLFGFIKALGGFMVIFLAFGMLAWILENA